MKSRIKINSNSNQDLDSKVPNDLRWPFNWVHTYWCQTSNSALQRAENDIICNINEPFKAEYVDIGPVIDSDPRNVHVWTLSMNKGSSDIPLILIHGMGSGLALWALNLDHLSKSTSRPIYAIDMPGFGRSTRINFSQNAQEAEEQYVQIIEAWRESMQLDKMILTGHSFGAYLSFSYSISFPKRVSHLICADPWGFSKRPADIADINHIPLLHRVIVRFMERLPLNPLWTVRCAGPLGPYVIKRIRNDLIGNFEDFMPNAPSKVSQYIFHCNAQNPTGESAFHACQWTFGWAKNPMHERIHLLAKSVPLTLIYGSRSWVDHYPAQHIIHQRHPSSTQFHVLNSGHHVYADDKEAFDDILLKVGCECDADSNKSDSVINL